ncbi:hypothetical protein VST7929_00181 [Vibrio stylophorae]|uniref:N-acetyltransferase domain-containing protein n=1 Tax=Vibrio stylophorae TaxID=659351 RepID=A0ABM8ZQK3_9VIBR|nr:GNAT family N-acetyltransferase [Vibrio stylophorae]CAH0532357.1 hypothetical protein VST7929_00181 [Vibrio stylophorae]
MTDPTSLSIQPLDPIRFPLAQRFYKTHYPAGKANKQETIWVLERQGVILGAVRFKLIGNEQLLTGMAIDSHKRGQGLGNLLLKGCLSHIQSTPCYCFAYAHLEGFYQQHGFETIEPQTLPNELRMRFERYSQTKNLITMAYQQPK